MNKIKLFSTVVLFNTLVGCKTLGPVDSVDFRQTGGIEIRTDADMRYSYAPAVSAKTHNGYGIDVMYRLRENDNQSKLEHGGFVGFTVPLFKRNK